MNLENGSNAEYSSVRERYKFKRKVALSNTKKTSAKPSMSRIDSESESSSSDDEIGISPKQIITTQPKSMNKIPLGTLIANEAAKRANLNKEKEKEKLTLENEGSGRPSVATIQSSYSGRDLPPVPKMLGDTPNVISRLSSDVISSTSERPSSSSKKERGESVAKIASALSHNEQLDAANFNDEINDDILDNDVSKSNEEEASDSNGSDDEQDEDLDENEVREQIQEHKELINKLPSLPWRMRKKLTVLRTAQKFVSKHEGKLEKKHKFKLHSHKLKKMGEEAKESLVELGDQLTPWENNIKEIESELFRTVCKGYFGSVVASYFTFLRWVFWENVINAAFVLALVIIPEMVLNWKLHGTTERKKIPDEYKGKEYDLESFWNFEGIMSASPIFYGYYSNSISRYRVPLAYLLVMFFVFGFGFVRILRRMAANSRKNRLSSKDEQFLFSWKLFCSWDFRIGHKETASNKAAEIATGFRELIVEAQEEQKITPTSVIFIRILMNIITIIILASSTVIVVKMASEESTTDEKTFWSQNGLAVVLSSVTLIYPSIFEFIGMAEQHHPRTSLRLQLGRILTLYLLNMYALIIGFYFKFVEGALKVDQHNYLHDEIKQNSSINYKHAVSEVLEKLFQLSYFRNLSNYENFNSINSQLILNSTNTTKELIYSLGTLLVLLSQLHLFTDMTKVDKSLSGRDLLNQTTPSIFNSTRWMLDNATFADLNLTEMSVDFKNESVNDLLNLSTLLSNWSDDNETTINNFSAYYNNITISTTSLKINSITQLLNFTYLDEQYLKSTVTPANEDFLAKKYEANIFTPNMNSSETNSNANSSKNTQPNKNNSNFSQSTISSPILLAKKLRTNISTEYDDIPLTTVETEPAINSINVSRPNSENFNNLNTTTSPFELITGISRILMNCTSENGSLHDDCPEIKTVTSKMPTLNMHKDHRKCWENGIAKEFYKLTAFDLVTTVGSILIIDFLRGLCVRIMNPCWFWNCETKFPEYGEFKIADNILHLIYNQGMVWMGTFFAPGLPVFNILKLIIMMYVRAWAVKTCNIPLERVFHVSRNSNIFYLILLFMLFLCMVPTLFVIIMMKPSPDCGPFSGDERMHDVLQRWLDSFSPLVRDIIAYIISPGVVIPMMLCFILGIYYLFSLTRSLKDVNQELRKLLYYERTEGRKKLYSMANKSNATGSSAVAKAMQNHFFPGVQSPSDMNAVVPSTSKSQNDLQPRRMGVGGAILTNPLQIWQTIQLNQLRVQREILELRLQLRDQNEVQRSPQLRLKTHGNHWNFNEVRDQLGENVKKRQSKWKNNLNQYDDELD